MSLPDSWDTFGVVTRTLQGQRTARTFAALRQHFGFSDQRLGDLAGYTLSQVEARRKGETPFTVDDMERFGGVFHIPPEVFLMDENEAIRWVLDHAITLDGLAVNNYSNRWARLVPESVDTAFVDREVASTGSTIQFRRKPARVARHLTTAA